MAYMDNAYKLIKATLASKMLPLAVIEVNTGAHATQIEKAIARMPDSSITDELRCKIINEFNRILPFSVEDAFLNSDKLCNAYPAAFKSFTAKIDDKRTATTQADLTTAAADDFMAYSSNLSLRSQVEINALDDKKTAIEAAREKSVYLRLNENKTIDDLIAGVNVSNLSVRQKDTFLWVSCYAKAMRISMREAFTDIFNYLGANTDVLIKEVSFSEGLAPRYQIKNFNELVMAAFG